MHVLGGEPAGPEQKLEPFRPAALGADLAAAQKVAFRDDADQLARRVDNRQAADSVLQHQARRLQQRFMRPDGNDLPRHDIANLHDRCLSVSAGDCRSISRRPQPFRRFSADRLRSTMRRELGTSIAAVLSRHVKVRDTVSMVRPR